jgi:hypothetical protein
MLDEGNDINLETPPAQPPEESNNRTFLIVGGVFAALIFLTLICGAVYVLWLGPKLSSQKNAAQATIEAQNAQVVEQMTSTAQAALATPTLPPTFTPTITDTVAAISPTVASTPVVVLNSPTPTETATTDPATLAAMQTELAGQMTTTAAVALGTRAIGGQGMPKTGFFDQVALPTLIVLTAALLAVIFLARRLRKTPTK